MRLEELYNNSFQNGLAHMSWDGLFLGDIMLAESELALSSRARMGLTL